jgi:large subunit ribosomal protein L15
MKGAGARKSSNLPLYFEGGQLPMVKRMPMIRGKSRFQSFGKVAEVNLEALSKCKTEKITLETLKIAGLVDKGAKAVKVVATGKLKKPLTVVGLRLTAGAKKALESVGGSVEV